MKTLGLDLGTNSIGWALLDTNGRQTTLVQKGVHIFEKGVGEAKGSEVSRASERTHYRSARRLKQRRRWRKQAALRVLVQHDMCPGLSETDIRNWRDRKQYPGSPEFMGWLRKDEQTASGAPAGPYFSRWLAATKPLDLKQAGDRHILGRALYHLAQRRGYRSNRVSGSEKDGDVAAAISELSAAMGTRTLGQYYYEDCLGKERVRGSQKYTSRLQYQAEFEKICDVQKLSPVLRSELNRAIFFQRPLKSQRGSVGKCVLEPSKPRVPISHPLFERFRALQTVNNIQMAAPGDRELRPLNEAERVEALTFLMRCRRNEKFEKLAKRLVPRRSRIAHVGHKHEDPIDVWRFNYRLDGTVSPCPTTAGFIELFGEEWPAEIKKRYTKAGTKTVEQVTDDIWHVIYSFDDHDKLVAYGKSQLGLSDEQALTFAKPPAPGYASLSLSAIRKILPYLEKGLIYSHAVFMAKLPDLIRETATNWSAEEVSVEDMIRTILRNHERDLCCERTVNALLSTLREEKRDPQMMMTTPATEHGLRTIIESRLGLLGGERFWKRLVSAERIRLIEMTLQRLLEQARCGKPAAALSLEERIHRYLREKYDLDERALSRLYHPSSIETYAAVKPHPERGLRLGSPRIESIKNPVFMRTMHRLRHILNCMLSEGWIDADTRIRIEMARDLNTANERGAIYREQKEREKTREAFRRKIEDLGFPATDLAVLKYMLWEEQGQICLYTGKQIATFEFLGDNPAFDIEHTIPRSRRLDNSQSNLTLCDRHYNREVKRDRIPSELPLAAEIAARAQQLWSDKIDQLEETIEKLRSKGRSATDKDTKDRVRQEFHYSRNRLAYLRDKMRNFERETVQEGFTNSQLVDTRIICKYALLYLKSAFPKVYSVKAAAVSAVKEVWGLDEKFRGNHAHHAIDAVVTACIGPAFYQELAAYYHQYERYVREAAPRPTAPEPWHGFAQELNERIPTALIVSRHRVDPLLKQTFRRLRHHGRIQRGVNGEPQFARGMSVRGSLHKETIYAKIKTPPATGSPHGEKPEMLSVVRRPLDKSFSDFDSIIDPEVRRLVETQREALAKEEPIWFDKSRGIIIRSVRVKVRNSPDSLISLGMHRDASKQDYKRHRYAANDGNYMTILYRGVINGRPKADFRVINNYDAVQAQRTNTWPSLIPAIDENGLERTHVLMTGMHVLFLRAAGENPEGLSPADLSRRLYHVAAMSEEGRIQFVHHLCGLSKGERGDGASAIDWSAQCPEKALRLSVNKLSIAVEGEAFMIDPLGRVRLMEARRA